MKQVFDQIAVQESKRIDSETLPSAKQFLSYLGDVYGGPGNDTAVAKNKELRKVLDLGCGPGNDSSLFIQAGLSVHGIDFSQPMIDLAQGRFSSKNYSSTVSFECRDVRFLKLDSGTIDAVWFGDLASYLKPEEIQRVVQSLFLAVKPKGLLGLVYIEGTGHQEDRPWGLDGPTRVQKKYSELALCSLVEQTGFKVKKIGRSLDQPILKLLIAERVV